jgi:dipeptidase E
LHHAVHFAYLLNASGFRSKPGGIRKFMSNTRLLLLSNSRNYGKGYLEHAEAVIKGFLRHSAERVLFIPYAAVRFSYSDFADGVASRFKAMGCELQSIHMDEDRARAVREASAIVVGGGNTFQLLREMYAAGIVDAIRDRALQGIPYIGWSAGSNVACPTIRTTNDMPIVEPPTLKALDLIPFQINPHYIEFHPPEHQGETREERLLEFIVTNPDVYVVALREGSLLKIEGSSIELLGEKPARVFRNGADTIECPPGQNFDFLWRRP